MYKPYIKVSGAWQKLTIDWTEVENGPTDLADLNDDSTHRLVTDSQISTWNAGGSGSTDLKPASFYSTTTTTDYSSGTTTVPLNLTHTSDSNYSLSTNQVTVTDAGVYLISYSIRYDITDTTGGTRGQTEAYVTADSLAIPVSYSAVYHREAAGGSGLSCSFIAALYASDVLQLNITALYGNTNINSERASFSIMKLE